MGLGPGLRPGHPAMCCWPPRILGVGIPGPLLPLCHQAVFLQGQFVSPVSSLLWEFGQGCPDQLFPVFCWTLDF